MAQTTRRIIIVGAAHPHVMGLIHDGQAIDGVQFLGVYDEDPERREAVARETGMPAADDLEALLKQQPHLAIVVAVPDQRADLAIRCVRAGAAVLVDKPLALEPSALDRLRQAVEQSGKPIITYYPTRGYPLVAAARQAIEQGRLGRVVHVLMSAPHWLRPAIRPAWHWQRATNGDILLDIGSHSFDTCCWLLGQSPCEVTAQMANFANPEHPEFRDFGRASLRFPNGALGHVQVDWLIAESMKHYSDMRLWIQGTSGRIDIVQGRRQQAMIWTQTDAGELAPVDRSMEQWTRELMMALCDGVPPAISQDDVWRASEVSLWASRAAREQEGSC